LGHGILTLNQALAGFGDPAVIFIAALFVVSAGLEVSGVTAWAGQVLIGQAGASRTRLIVLMMGFVGVLAAMISVNGAVAALLPVVVVMAIRLGQSPSQLLMPLVFGAHAGSQLMLTGSPVNVLVVEASGMRAAPALAISNSRWWVFRSLSAALRSWFCSASGCCRSAPARRCRRT
jgi:Na+/H+ antiporter NhaD/arsenite permease-like protein